MNITDWSNKEIIRFLTSRKCITQKLLISKMTKQLKQGSFSGKLSNDGLKVSELQNICEILGFELLIQEKK